MSQPDVMKLVSNPVLLFHVRKNPFFTSSSGFVLSHFIPKLTIHRHTLRIQSNDVTRKSEKSRTYGTFKKVFILSSFWVPWKK